MLSFNTEPTKIAASLRLKMSISPCIVCRCSFLALNLNWWVYIHAFVVNYIPASILWLTFIHSSVPCTSAWRDHMKTYRKMFLNITIIFVRKIIAFNPRRVTYKSFCLGMLVTLNTCQVDKSKSGQNGLVRSFIVSRYFEISFHSFQLLIMQEIKIWINYKDVIYR